MCVCVCVCVRVCVQCHSLCMSINVIISIIVKIIDIILPMSICPTVMCPLLPCDAPGNPCVTDADCVVNELCCKTNCENICAPGIVIRAP